MSVVEKLIELSKKVPEKGSYPLYQVLEWMADVGIVIEGGKIKGKPGCWVDDGVDTWDKEKLYLTPYIREIKVLLRQVA